MSDKEDLEDGEIEDDEEEMAVDVPSSDAVVVAKNDHEPKLATEKKPEKVDKRSGSIEDDWTTNVEKAMANVLKKAGVEPPLPNISAAKEVVEEAPVPKSRKRRKPKSERNKNKESKKTADATTTGRVEIFNVKRQKMNEEDGEEYADEYEMMNVRGGSPPPNVGTIVVDDDSVKGSSDAESYDSDEFRKMSYEERRQRRREQMRQSRRERSKERDRDDRRRDRERDRRDRERDRNDDHRREPRKLEICKFYLLDCCAKRDKCSYLHSEFPCKYYYLGMKCPLKDCKFNHGKPLTDQFRGILLKHLETAPKEILGDFPRIGRDKALKLMDAQHLKLLARERGEKEPDSLSTTPNIPSLLDSLMPKRNNNAENRARRTRWCDMAVPPAPTLPEEEKGKAAIPDYMNIKNMTGILTGKQIEQLLEMGIESVEQITQLTLLQIGNIGLTINQITEVQSNVQNLEKLMQEKNKLQDDADRTPQASPSPPPPAVINLDLDLRISEPVVDVDLRLLPPPSNVPIAALVEKKDDDPPIDPQKLQNFRNMFGGSSSSSSLVDFSQYLKDASMREEPVKDETKQTNEEVFNEDDESELQIDESCYSEDEEAKDKKSSEERKEEQKSDDAIMSPVHTQESIIATLKELEKMKQKEEKQAQQSTSLTPQAASYNPAMESLSMFSSFYEPAVEKVAEIKQLERIRRVSNEIKSPSLSDSADESFIKRPSIYDHYSDEDENDDYGNIAKKTDKDMRMAAIDTDTGDIDLRLPFKPILASLIPASEINASITAHPPISYKVVEIEIPKPSFRGLKHTKGSTDKVHDPRLVRLLRLKEGPRARRDSRSSDYDSSATPRSPDPVPNKPAPPPRLDPRRRRDELAQSSSNTLISSPNSGSNARESNQLDMQGLMVLLQKSGWYQQLNSNSKISVNQTLARLSGEIKKFHQDPAVDKVFDLTFITSDPYIPVIMNNLGVYLNENGYFCHVDDTPTKPAPMLPNLSQPPPGTLPMNHLPTGIDLNVLSNLGSLLNQAARPGFIPPPRPSLLGMPPPLLTNPLLNESLLRGLLPPSLNVPPPSMMNDNFNGNRGHPQQQQHDRRGNWGVQGNNSRRNNDYRADPRRNRD